MIFLKRYKRYTIQAHKLTDRNKVINHIVMFYTRNIWGVNFGYFGYRVEIDNWKYILTCSITIQSVECADVKLIIKFYTNEQPVKSVSNLRIESVSIEKPKVDISFHSFETVNDILTYKFKVEHKRAIKI